VLKCQREFWWKRIRVVDVIFPLSGKEIAKKLPYVREEYGL
jgi:hypothetical protein